MLTSLNASVIIDGTWDIAPYAISIKRNHNLCSITQTFVIELDKSIVDFLTLHSIDLKPSTTIVIYEFGVKKLTGHVRTIRRGRTPDYRFTIEGTDLYKYAKDYFIDSDLGTSTGESVTYWIGRLLGLIGLSYSIDSTQISQRTVAPDVEFNLRSVDDALTEVISYAGGYTYCDADGVVHFQKGAPSSSWQFTSGHGGNVTKGTHDFSDENTRDVAKVWGYKGNIILSPGESPLLFATDTVDLGLPVNKTVVYASNAVQTYTEAQRIASDIILSLGKFDSIKTLEIVGDPNIFIGKEARINVNLETSVLNETALITTINSDLSKEGYTMQVGFDEFCPKFAGWELAIQNYPLYAGTHRNGIYKSEDNGDTWTEFNTGLPTGNLHVQKMAYNYLDEGMAIVSKWIDWTHFEKAKLYYSDGTSWELITLPNGGIGETVTNPLLVSVDSAGPGTFYVIAGGLGSDYYAPRSWLYSTSDSGKTWSSEQVQATGVNKFYPVDVNSKNGFPYVLVRHPQLDADVSNIRLGIGQNKVITRGSGLPGSPITASEMVYAADDPSNWGIAPFRTGSSETSRILSIYQNSDRFINHGLIDPQSPYLDVTVRLVLSNYFTLYPYNPYYSPRFLGALVGGTGYAGTNCGTPAWTAGIRQMTVEEYNQGWFDLGLTFNKNTDPYFNEFGGYDICFYVGAHFNSSVYDQLSFNLNNYVLQPERSSFAPGLFGDQTYPNLLSTFTGFPFRLKNLYVNW